MVGRLSFRVAGEDDVPALMQLWNQSTRWGEAEASYWSGDDGREQFVIVAVDEGGSGAVVGQLGFVSRDLFVDGTIVRGFRLTSAIVHKRFQAASLFDHPLTRMYTEGVLRLLEHGAQLIYALPNRAVLRFFEPYPFFRYGSFAMWSLPLPLARPAEITDDVRAWALDSWDERIDGLWAAWCRAYEGVVVGTAAKYRERLERGDDLVAVERGTRLVGIGSAKWWHRGWMIGDVIAADESSLRTTLAAVAARGDAVRAADGSDVAKVLQRVDILVTPPLAGAAAALGFTPTSYEFNLVVHVLDEDVSEDAVSPERWLLGGED